MSLWYVTGPAIIAGAVAITRQVLVHRFNRQLLEFYARLLEQDAKIACEFVASAKDLAPFQSSGRGHESEFGIASVMKVAGLEAAPTTDTGRPSSSGAPRGRAAS